MEQYSTTMFEDVRHEKSLIKLASLIMDPDILKQSKFTDLELNVIENLVQEKLHRERIIYVFVAVSLIE